MQEFRCKDCGKLLMKATLFEGEVEIKCRACHALNIYGPTLSCKLLCGVTDCPHRVQVGAFGSRGL
ncbi:MAG: Com family DNA-binding transcriptional regulator [Patescibacteria group bacterium]